MLSYLTGSNQNGLENVTHLFIDEVHERDVNVDFLLRVVKQHLSRTNLKIILMSATVESTLFSGYFNGCFTMGIAGRAYDVEEIYLGGILKMIDPSATANEAELENSYNSRNDSHEKEYVDDHDLITSLIDNLHRNRSKNEGILVFQPGAHSIELLKDEIQKKMTTNDYRVFIVHSQIKGGASAFTPLHSSIRKIVLATNIAETSITIENMVRYCLYAFNTFQNIHRCIIKIFFRTFSNRYTSLIAVWLTWPTMIPF